MHFSLSLTRAPSSMFGVYLQMACDKLQMGHFMNFFQQ